jgi:hypothetical protein
MVRRWMVVLTVVTWSALAAAALAGAFDRSPHSASRVVRRERLFGRPKRRLCETQAWASLSGNSLTGVAASSRSRAWAVGETSAGQTTIKRWNGRGWKRLESPNPGGEHCSVLSAVAIAGPGSAWAVGYYSDGHMLKTLVVRWNGAVWRQVPSVSPGGSHGDSALADVIAVGSRDAWAVGYTERVTGSDPRDPHVTSKTLIERWNGRRWKLVPSPSPAGSHEGDTSGLTGIAAGPAGVWAVGSYRRPGTYPKTLVLRWNGKAWKQVRSASPGCGGALAAVATAGSSGAWAVGNYCTGPVPEPLIERWNGRAWKQLASPRAPGSQGELEGVSATGPSNAWAVGQYAGKSREDPAIGTLIERWNGRAWRHVSSPNPGGSVCCHGEQNSLSAISAASGSNAWATGSYSAGSAFGQTLIEHWTGGSWTVSDN